MCEKMMPPEERDERASPQLLSRIADTLGVPVSRFYEAGRSSRRTGPSTDAGMLLALVGAFMESADTDARARFAEAVAAMAKTCDGAGERRG